MVNGYQNFDFDKHVIMEEATKPSLTVQHHTMTLQELVERFTRGAGVKILDPTYAIEDDNYDELDLIDISKLDEMEKLDMAKELKTAIEMEKVAMAARAEEKEEKAKERKIGKRAVEAFEKVLGIYEESPEEP